MCAAKQRVVFAVVLALVIIGCGGDTDDAYAKYYEGGYRDNKNGTVEVVNPTASDMLLFEGETIDADHIVGGARALGNAKVNFAGKSDFAAGGYTMLRAVKEEDFKADGENARICYTQLVAYGEGSRFTMRIFEAAAVNGDWEFTVSNGSAAYGFELRRGSPEGEIITYITRGQTGVRILWPNSHATTLYPVWVAWNATTKSLVTFTSELSAVGVQPVPLGTSSSSVYVFTPDMQLP
jgi:hypothetical protein